MKYSVAALALAAAVSAQQISDIPACALPCIDDARSKNTDCAADDYKCICDNIDSLTAAATSCVLSACGADTAVNEVLPAVQTFCAAVEAGGSGSSSSSDTPTSEPTSTPSSTPTSEPSSTPTSEPTSSESTVTSKVTTSASLPITTFPTISSFSTYPGSTLTPTLSPTYGGGNTTVAPTSSSTAAPTSSTPAPTSSPIPTGGAAAVGSVGGLAMMVLGALAAF